MSSTTVNMEDVDVEKDRRAVGKMVSFGKDLLSLYWQTSRVKRIHTHIRIFFRHFLLKLFPSRTV